MRLGETITAAKLFPVAIGGDGTVNFITWRLFSSNPCFTKPYSSVGSAESFAARGEG
jgi:hypothetical protein